LYKSHADIRHCELASQLLYQASPKAYEYLFQTGSKTAIEFIQYEFQRGGGICGHRNVRCLIENDQIIGTYLFYNTREFNTISLQTVRNVLAFYPTFEVVRVLFRLLRLGSIMKSPRKGEVYLSNFSVALAFQGKGFGSTLLCDAREDFRKDKFEVMGLDVEVENVKAKALYNRLGFVDRERKTLSIGQTDTLGVIKMELRL